MHRTTEIVQIIKVLMNLSIYLTITIFHDIDCVYTNHDTVHITSTNQPTKMQQASRVTRLQLDSSQARIHKVDFLDCYNSNPLEPRCLVYIHPSQKSQVRGFFYMYLISPHQGTLACCTYVPEGYLTSYMSRYMYIQLDLPVTYFTYSCQDMENAKVTYENFRQDEFVWATCGCSVENYLTDIIDQLIWHQDNLTLAKTESKVLKTDSQVLTVAEHNCVVNNHQDLQFDTLEHLAIHSELDITVAGKRTVNCDIVIPHKTRGFLNHETKKFKFIGPDRQPVKIQTIDQCINLAQIIRATGKPNYVSARIPLVSGLNIDAWEFHVS